MEEHIKSQFRVTAWPGPLPHPEPGRASQYELRNGVFMHDARAALDELRGKREPGARRWTGPPSQRFDEVYLQLMLLDLDDQDAILAWVNEFGLIRVHERSRFTWSTDHPAGPYLRLVHYPGVTKEFKDWLLEESDSTRRGAGFDFDEPKVWYPVTLDEFQWGAGCIRDMARAYWCLSTGADPAELPWDNPVIDERLELQARDPEIPWWDHDEMRGFLVSSLELGLEDFQPRLVPEEIGQLRGRERSRLLAEHVVDWQTDLYAICCLELFNHIGEGAVYRTCANETCGRWFVRQRGRSKHDQRRRSGVKFCSYACARQQTQRNHRRRARDGRRNSG